MMIDPDKYPGYEGKSDFPLTINGTVLPYLYKLEADNLSVRLKAEKRAYSHGSTISGDGYIDGKTIKLKLIINENSRTACLQALNKVYALLYQHKYKLSTGDGYWVVDGVQKLTTKYYKGFQFKRCELQATLLLGDPFRYGMDREFIVSCTQQGEEPFTFSISNGGSVATPLLLTFEPLDGTANDINLALGDRALHIQDTLLTTPAKLYVDTSKGTVRRDSFNAINAFSGSFLSLEKGLNLFEYRGSLVKVRFQWTDRWLV